MTTHYCMYCGVSNVADDEPLAGAFKDMLVCRSCLKNLNAAFARRQKTANILYFLERSARIKRDDNEIT
jgi:hypothetical protein